VAQNVALTILPGSVLSFANATRLLAVGSLLADGTVADPIFFSYLQLNDNPEHSWNGQLVGNGGDWRNRFANC